MILACMALVSCVDTIILPDDKTVDEDFWQSKEDVALMVNSAYASMASEALLTRLVIWGDFRSDEMVRSSALTGAIPDALDEISTVNMQTTNTFASWNSVYSVINYCNIVLERAEAVMQLDPNYTQSDYESDRCQMLALRSLCYFYLVRNFRDVPYVTTAFMNSSQDMQIPQSSPEYVIGQIILTLEEVASNANMLRSDGMPTSEWRRVGWFRLDAVNALLADVYLWRASVLHSTGDYQKCIEYCDKVIASKRSQHVRGRNEVQEKEFPLADGNSYYSDIFVTQNAEESIFEIQSTGNLGLCKYLYKYNNNNSTEGFLRASNIFGNGTLFPNGDLSTNNSSSTDLRFYSACYTSSDDYYHIKKMVSQQNVTTKAGSARSNDRTYTAFDQNYIVYRLSDVMLMRAEAMVQLVRDLPEGASDTEKAANTTLLQGAFHLVQVVNTRSLYTDNLTDSMKWNTYRSYTKDQMERLVLEERLRELCFEGKRWYDLLRYNYRHVEGVNYAQTFGEQMQSLGSNEINLVDNYEEMLNLATRSRGADAPAIKAKMRNEAYLYMPIPNADIIVCPLLVQNPAYRTSGDFEKSY